jgi:hypothetical protein
VHAGQGGEKPLVFGRVLEAGRYEAAEVREDFRIGGEIGSHGTGEHPIRIDAGFANQNTFTEIGIGDIGIAKRGLLIEPVDRVARVGDEKGVEAARIGSVPSGYILVSFKKLISARTEKHRRPVDGMGSRPMN